MRITIKILLIFIVLWGTLNAQGQNMNIKEVREKVYQVYESIIDKNTKNCEEMAMAQELIEAYKTLTYMDPEAKKTERLEADRLLKVFSGTHSNKCRVAYMKVLKNRYFWYQGYFGNSVPVVLPGIRTGKEIPAYILAKYFMSKKAREQYINQLPNELKQGMKIWQEENKEFDSYLEYSKKQAIEASQIEDMKDILNFYVPKIDKDKSKYHLHSSQIKQMMEEIKKVRDSDLKEE